MGYYILPLFELLCVAQWFKDSLCMMLKLILIWKIWWCWYDDANYNSNFTGVCQEMSKCLIPNLMIAKKWVTDSRLDCPYINSCGVTSWIHQLSKNQENNTTKMIVAKTDTVYKIKRIPDWYEFQSTWYAPSDDWLIWFDLICPKRWGLLMNQ